MSKSAIITRRSLIHLSVCLSVWGLTRPVHVLAKIGGFRIPDPLAVKLATFFRRQESAAVIGREYLRFVPQEADERLLVELICSSRAERRADLVNANARKLRELLQLQQRQDFEASRIVNIRGWLLSETEARLCALVALS